jgi:hypothetical protein
MASTAQKSPYQFEELTVQIQRSKLGAFWRWRTEMSLISGSTGGFCETWHLIGIDLAGVAFGGGLALVLALPWTRRFLAARFWCLLTRHRLQRAFWEMRLHTRAGRLPLVLWTHGTKVGVRAYILATAGTSRTHYENAAEVFAAACGAREARVTASPRWSQLITIDIMRRDALSSRLVVPSVLVDMPEPAPGEVPALDPEPLTWPELSPDGH